MYYVSSIKISLFSDVWFSAVRNKFLLINNYFFGLGGYVFLLFFRGNFDLIRFSVEEFTVYCRIGSLEAKLALKGDIKNVYCRIGSLEGSVHVFSAEF